MAEVPDVPKKPVVGTLLDHVPPVVASFKVTAYPTHTADEPVIGNGDGFTVTLCIT